MATRWQGILLAWLLTAACVIAGTVEQYAARIAPLIDPAKLATLRERGANPRVQKYVAQLADAQQAHFAPEKVAARAVEMAGMKGEAAKLTVAAMVRNLTITERLGCLDANGLSDMRKGQSPTVQRGPYAGDQLSVDHIIPRAVVPELDNVIANLELMPLRANASKNAKVGQRQMDLARKLNKAGLRKLSADDRKRRLPPAPPALRATSSPSKSNRLREANGETHIIKAK